MDEILSKPLMVSFNLDLKLDNEDQNERACKGLSFMVNKKYQNIDGIDCCLLTLEITEGDVINVIAKEPASTSSILTSNDNHKFQFIINDFHRHLDSNKINEIKLEFHLKPKILNCCSWSEKVQVPYGILKNLNFGEYYRHDIKLLENRSITLNGYWSSKKDEWGRFIYEYCLINKNGIKIQDENEDFIHTISADYFQDDDFYARKIEDETFHIEFFIDLDVVQKDGSKSEKVKTQCQSPPAKEVLNPATQISELEAWMRSTTIYDAFELFKRSQKTKETTPPTNIAKNPQQLHPNIHGECNLCEGLCFCSDKKRFEDVLSKFIPKASSDDVHNLSHVLNVLNEDELKLDAKSQDESVSVANLEGSTEIGKCVETQSNEIYGTFFFNEKNQDLQNALADIQNSMNLLTNIFSNFKKTDRALQPKIVTTVTKQIKGMSQAWQERHPGWENGIWDFNDTKKENDDSINEDSADDLEKSAPFLNESIINDKKEIGSSDKAEEAYVIESEENEIQPITDFMNKGESCCSSTGSWEKLDLSEPSENPDCFSTCDKSENLLTESSKTYKTNNFQKHQNQAHESRAYNLLEKRNELAILRKKRIATTENDLEAIEEMISSNAFQEFQHLERHETFFDALDGQNSSSISKNETVESKSQKMSDIRKNFGGYDGILEKLKRVKEKSLADEQNLFESNFLKPFEPLKSSGKIFSSPDNVLFKTFDGHSVHGRQSDLSQISPILKDIFEKSTEKPCEINVTFDRETMQKFINYSRGIKNAVKNHEFKLYKVAQEFGFDDLKAKCIESFEEQMNPSGYDPEGIEARRENIKKLFETT